MPYVSPNFSPSGKKKAGNNRSKRTTVLPKVRQASLSVRGLFSTLCFPFLFSSLPSPTFSFFLFAKQKGQKVTAWRTTRSSFFASLYGVAKKEWGYREENNCPAASFLARDSLSLFSLHSKDNNCLVIPSV
jgi:hypothetical protein